MKLKWYKKKDIDNTIVNMSKCTKRQRKLCLRDTCSVCTERSFGYYDGLTPKGNRKVDCWNYEKNEGIIPYKITKRSGKKYWFKCDECDHSFKSTISTITSSKQHWCPYCSNQKLCDNKDCDDCFKKSFASYEGLTLKGNKKVNCWDFEQNDTTPRNISFSNGSKYWFKCDICYHSFESVIFSITRKKPTWCPYCVNQKLCDNNKCDFCFNNSFASYEKLTLKGNRKVDCWDFEKNNTIPRNISKGTDLKYWFKCDICEHSFDSMICNIISKNETWCSYCCIPVQKLCNNECDHCFNNSFSSYEGLTPKGNKKVDCWNYEKNSVIPRNITKRNSSKYWFKCDLCDYSFKSTIHDITCSKKPTWCPFCKNKTESKFKHWFHKQYPELKLKHQPKYDWCKNPETEKHRPFDFVVEDTKTIIEIDGEQHFTQISNWKDPDEQLQIDKFKMNVAMENGYSIIRILQEDIWFDKNRWEEKFIVSFKLYEDPTVICIGCDVKYSKHI